MARAIARAMLFKGPKKSHIYSTVALVILLGLDTFISNIRYEHRFFYNFFSFFHDFYIQDRAEHLI